MKIRETHGSNFLERLFNKLFPDFQNTFLNKTGEDK